MIRTTSGRKHLLLVGEGCVTVKRDIVRRDQPMEMTANALGIDNS